MTLVDRMLITGVVAGIVVAVYGLAVFLRADRSRRVAEPAIGAGLTLAIGCALVGLLGAVWGWWE